MSYVSLGAFFFQGNSIAADVKGHDYGRNDLNYFHYSGNNIFTFQVESEDAAPLKPKYDTAPFFEDNGGNPQGAQLATKVVNSSPPPVPFYHAFAHDLNFREASLRKIVRDNALRVFNIKT